MLVKQDGRPGRAGIILTYENPRSELVKKRNPDFPKNPKFYSSINTINQPVLTSSKTIYS